MNLEAIILKKPNQQEFLKIAEFSFANFIRETAESSGQSVDELKNKLGSPPSEMSENDLWYVVEYMDINIGFLWIKLGNKNSLAFGYDIYLDLDFRSKGIGRHIMKLCGKELKNLGFKVINICVFEGNKVARQLYESFVSYTL